MFSLSSAFPVIAQASDFAKLWVAAGALFVGIVNLAISTMAVVAYARKGLADTGPYLAAAGLLSGICLMLVAGEFEHMARGDVWGSVLLIVTPVLIALAAICILGFRRRMKR